MDRNDVMSIMKDNPRFFLATCDGRQPRVRVISLLQADDDGIVFVTGKHKDVYRQICDNPLIELLFWDPKKLVQIRVSGYVECVEDHESKRKTVEKFPFLRKRIEEHGYDYLCIFRLRSGRALVWTRDADEAPGEKCYIDLG